jgi:hypothetical protein
MFGKKYGSKTTQEFSYENMFNESTEHDDNVSKKLKMANITPIKSYNAVYKSRRSSGAANQNENFNDYNSTKLQRLSELENNNLYALLDVDEYATTENIKKSYRNLCKVHHPDKGGEPEHFQRIQNAYKILSNDFYRRLYDKNSSKAFELINILSAKENEIDPDEMLNYSIDDINLFIQMKNN